MGREVEGGRLTGDWCGVRHELLLSGWTKENAPRISPGGAKSDYCVEIIDLSGFNTYWFSLIWLNKSLMSAVSDCELTSIVNLISNERQLFESSAAGEELR